MNFALRTLRLPGNSFHALVQIEDEDFIVEQSLWVLAIACNVRPQMRDLLYT